MKRFATISLVIAALLTIVSGCSSKSAEKDNNNKKTLVIGINDKLPPMGFRDKNNKLVGFDIDYAKAAAKIMGVKVKFQPIDWTKKELELDSGRIDLIWSGYTVTNERKEKVLFTKPYLANTQVVVTLKNSNIAELDDLEGKVVGLKSLSSARDVLEASSIKSRIKTVTEFTDNVTALNDLKNGRIDAVFMDEIIIDYYMNKESDTYKVLNEYLAPEEYGVGVKKGNEELLGKLQNALDELNEDGTATEISTKWFGVDKLLN